MIDRPVATNEIDAQGDELLLQARQVQTEDESLVASSADLRNLYNCALQTYVDEKYRQAETIENRLEGLLDQQEALLRQYQSNQGGISMLLNPGKRAALQQNISARQACILRLQNRLELVREIEHDIAAHGQKLEELAARKLRFHEPELVAQWDGARAAERRNQAQNRRERSKTQQAGRTLSWTRNIER